MASLQRILSPDEVVCLSSLQENELNERRSIAKMTTEGRFCFWQDDRDQSPVERTREQSQTLIKDSFDDLMNKIHTVRN